MFNSSKEYVNLMIQEQERKNKQVKKPSNNTNFDYLGIQESVSYNLNKKNRQINDLKKSLLSECIYKIFDKSLGFQLENGVYDVMKRSLVNNFIEEQGTQTLIGSFKRNSYMLSEFARVIESTVETVVEKCEKEGCEDIEIDPDTKSDFYEQIDTDDVDEVVSVIKTRVSDAVDDFLQSNMKDKLEIEDIIRNTQEKVDKAKTEAVKESYERQGKQAISQVRNRGSKNILESMVYSVSAAAYKNKDMSNVYLQENSSLNLDTIVERCQIMYTFLETVSTAKIKKIDEKYVSNVLKGLEA